jgi:hypothetical protein
MRRRKRIVCGSSSETAPSRLPDALDDPRPLREDPRPPPEEPKPLRDELRDEAAPRPD